MKLCPQCTHINLYTFLCSFKSKYDIGRYDKVSLEEFKTRVFDSDKQVWSASMSSMPKLRILELFKTSLCVETYLLLHIARRLRAALVKFKVGNYDLEMERGRHAKIPVNERFCKFCFTLNENHIEDEYHVLLKCPFYGDLRKIYL